MIEFELDEDPADALLLRFDEPTPASDAIGNHDDGAAIAGMVVPTFIRELPPLVRTLSACGRAFDETTGYEFEPGADNAGTTGPVGIVAVVWIDWDAQWATGAPAVIVGQGLVTARSWELRVELIDHSTRAAALRLVWDVGGAELAVSAGEFVAPSTPFMVIASRESTSDGWVVRYHAAGHDLGETLVVGTPALAATPVHVGVRSDGAGHLIGALDQVHVVHRAICAEEAELLDYRVRCAGAEVYTARRALAAATHAWSRDLHTAVQRELQVEAATMALVKTAARRLARYSVPHRAWGAWLRYWEQLVVIPLRPGDGIATRRARVITALRGRLGCSADDLRALIAESLGYSGDPSLADVAVGPIEYADAFTPLSTSGGVYVSGHAHRAWLAYPDTHCTFTLPVGANNYLQADMGAVTRDLRYAGWLGQGDVADTNPPRYLRFLGSGANRATNARGDATGDRGKWVRVRGELRAAPSFPSGIVVGVMVGSLLDDDWLWVGVKVNGGQNDVGYVRYQDGVLDSAISVIATNVGALPRVIEVTHASDGVTGVGTYQIRHASAVAGIAAAPVVTIGGPARPDWGGFGLTSPAATATVTGPLQVRWSDWWQRTPHAGGPLHLRMYRDPADPGIYDTAGADSILQANLLGHLAGTVIDGERGLSLETTATLVDRDPFQH